MAFLEQQHSKLIARAFSVANPEQVIQAINSTHEMWLLERMIRMALQRKADELLYLLRTRDGITSTEMETLTLREYTVTDVMQDIDHNAIYAMALADYRDVVKHREEMAHFAEQDFSEDGF